MEPMRLATDPPGAGRLVPRPAQRGRAHGGRLRHLRWNRRSRLRGRRAGRTSRRRGALPEAARWASSSGSVSGVVALIGGAVFVVGSKKDAASAPLPPSERRPIRAGKRISGSRRASAAMGPAPRRMPADMIAIPGGSFFMGSDDGLPLEKPAHQVVLAPFCIDEFEVTVDKYKACSDAGRVQARRDDQRVGRDRRQGPQGVRPALQRARSRGAAKHPINCVDWEMADKFCHEQGGACRPRPSGSLRRAGPTGASTRGATTIPRPA
jgi:formylglycine-generating enzyme required for sulfatase activity